MKNTIMFHGEIMRGYLIKRIEKDRFLWYTPSKYLTNRYAEPIMNLHELHAHNGSLHLYKYPIDSNMEI